MRTVGLSYEERSSYEDSGSIQIALGLWHGDNVRDFQWNIPCKDNVKKVNSE